MAGSQTGFGGGTFTADEAAYLRSLPAVQDVRDDRVIIYSEAFKRKCMQRYYAGETPSAIFRSAGLDPLLIGYKRIERCIARWRHSSKRRRRTSGSEPDVVASSAKTDIDMTLAADTDIATPVEFQSMPASAPTTWTYPPDSRICMLIITQQARRIETLERKIRELYAENLRLRSGRDDASTKATDETPAH